MLIKCAEYEYITTSRKYLAYLEGKSVKYPQNFGFMASDRMDQNGWAIPRPQRSAKGDEKEVVTLKMLL